MSLQFKTFYSDAACTVPIRVSFPPGSCENIRLDTSCRQDSGYFSRSSCTTSDGLAALGTELFGNVSQLQVLSDATKCATQLKEGPYYSFQYPFDICVPNIEGNTFSKRTGATTVETIPFTHEKVTRKDGDGIFVTGFKDANCTVKVDDSVGFYLGSEFREHNSGCVNWTVYNRGFPFLVTDQYFGVGCGLPVSASVYLADSCLQYSGAPSDPQTETTTTTSPAAKPASTATAPACNIPYGTPQRQCSAQTVVDYFQPQGFFNRPYFVIRRGKKEPLKNECLETATSSFAALLNKCVPTGLNGTYSISTVNTTANKSFLLSTVYGSSECNGTVLETQAYEVSSSPGPQDRTCTNFTRVDLMNFKSSSVILRASVGLILVLAAMEL
ncbi:hypothetical protein BDR26DRAFT_362151 [Obelidium mucronatum]|nr:hypothetical protein BDR26DRAFT_362151 [Obelidium mucronatum]